MAQIVHNTTYSVSSNASSPLSGTTTDQGSAELIINQVIPAASTNATTGIIFNGANLQHIELLASQNLTLKVNSSGSPFVTISLKANIPYDWSASAAYFTNQFNVSVTEIYATCTPTTTLKGKVLTT